MIETPDLTLVTEALRRGLRVVWNPPRFRGSSESIALVKEVPQTACEVLRRAAIFRAQLEKSSLIPLLVLPDAPDSPVGCISCGSPISQGFRCQLCELAVYIALDLPVPSAED